VHVLAYPKRVFKARVSYIAALVDPVTHRLPVRAEIDNLDGALKPEMFATFRILTGDAASSPAVPESAVVYEGDLAHVWVLSDGGLLAYRAVLRRCLASCSNPAPAFGASERMRRRPYLRAVRSFTASAQPRRRSMRPQLSIAPRY